MAGLWREWDELEGAPSLSFTMLMVSSANEHSLMRWFHRPNYERRSVVVLRPEKHDDWLGCRSTAEARSFLRLFPAGRWRQWPGRRLKATATCSGSNLFSFLQAPIFTPYPIAG
ncbi:SOS response-associated peptidase family protein [Paraburkholderia aspalathi]|uniref:SOS response-associated peptidase family protein n=1 Tax=Paraburkholderia aspalathi TaxID=1324617 RepID=UPI0038B7B93E